MKLLLVLVVGIFVGVGGLYSAQMSGFIGNDKESSASSDEGNPLYWVAPMDPNYRRDQPGKSPMGMDLIPVYAKDQSGGDSSPGTIKIAPEVVNNLSVRTAAASQGTLAPAIRTVGYLEYDQSRIVHVHPRVEGWVEKSFMKSDGDTVKKGDPLYDLYSPALVNAQEELLFAMARNEPRLIKASEQRLKALDVDAGLIKQLKASRQVSQTVRFFAPSSGVIDNLMIRDGYFVQPGMTLLSIADLNEIWMEGEVFERQAQWVKEGLPVRVSLDYNPGDERIGSIDYVYPSIDPKTRTLRVRVKLANTDLSLKPNMFAQMQILVADDQSRLLVPNEAVIRGGQQDRIVMALGEGRFKSVAVKTGLRDDTQVEILDGLRAGDKLVTSAQFLLDSESSKTSDFQRMMTTEEKEEKEEEKIATSAPAAPVNKVWVAATVLSIDDKARKLNAQHEAIPEWKWPTMTMDFNVDEWVELGDLPVNKPLQIEITRDASNRYQVTDFYEAQSE